MQRNVGLPKVSKIYDVATENDELIVSPAMEKADTQIALKHIIKIVSKSRSGNADDRTHTPK